MIITWEDALEAKAKGIAEGDLESRLERIDDLGRLHEMLEQAIKAASLADVDA